MQEARKRILLLENEILRCAAAYMSQASLQKRCSRWSANWPPTGEFRSAVICRVLGFSKQAFFAGIPALERRAWRLCSSQRIWSTFSKKRGLSRKAGPPVHDDLVQRQFTATSCG